MVGPPIASRCVGSVAGVILGAGSSRRLGRPKQTLALGETTLLGWIVREAEASSLDRVVVVARGDVDTGRAEVAQPDPGDTTCSASLRAGLARIGVCDAVMLLLGDTPEVDASVIDAVRAAWESARPWGLVTRYDEGLGHPLVFAADALPSLRTLRGEKAVWKLLESEPDRVEHAAVERPLPRDVDSWDDYEALLEALL
jgi:molybdenum cofactor cytidylyltransferase